ncbi:MAG: hypothetical protein VW127_02265, partial [Flavobacteriaceae bacterium]
MKTVLRLSIIIILFSCNKKEDPQEQVTNDCIGEYTTAGILVEIDEEIQDTLVSAFFGLDNALPSLLLCNQQVGLLDGMPVNFKFPLDASSLSETDFEVLDSLGNIHTPMCVSLAPANENGENRTVLLLGEFGTAVTNPPVEVRVVGDLFTTDTLS